MIPVLTEVPLGGEDQLWPNTAPLSAGLLGGASVHRKKGKAPRRAGDSENCKLRSDRGAATCDAEQSSSQRC